MMYNKLKSERSRWIDVMLTLVTLELMAYFYYGVRAFWIGAVCVMVSLITEFTVLRLRRRNFTADDLSCTSDALIIALMMPASINALIPAIACIFAVIAAKHVFGGRSNMIFSPAAAAYVFALTSWSKDLNLYPKPYDKAGIFEDFSDLVSSASHRFNLSGTMDSSDLEILLGSFAGPMGSVSILILMVSAAILIFRRDISVGAFLGTIFGTVFTAYLCPITDSRFDCVKFILVTNMTLFAAIYIISDKRITPEKNYYAFFYGLFIAVFSYVITITTGRENVIVIVSVLFTPAALALKKLENKIKAEKTVSVNENNKNGEILKTDIVQKGADDVE